MLIELTKGQVAIIDDEDYQLIAKHRWHANEYRPKLFRAVARTSRKEGHKSIYMHRLLLGVTDVNTHVDHIDGNPLNNRRNNLRICTNHQNRYNSKTPSTNTTGYKGVYLNKYNGRYYAYISSNNIRTSLGGYSSPEDAYAAYCKAAHEMHGVFART